MHCTQCKKDYPQGTTTCPVHHVALSGAGESPTLAVRPAGRTPPPVAPKHPRPVSGGAGAAAAAAVAQDLSIAAEPEDQPADGEEDKELPAGTMCGEYRVVEKIGQGGMGSVYAGLHPLIGKKVAIKVLNWRMSDDSSIMQRFVLEARAVNQIGHHNIVDIFAYGTLADGRPYLVMEYLQGQTLKARLRSQPLMTYAEVFDIVVSVCNALAAAHEEKIIHRDLKPDNIFLAVSKSQRQVKLLDFGIAKLLHRDDSAQYTRTGASIGTPTYMAPEQCLNRAVDARTDIYALGVIMYVIFTGNRPFGGASAFEILDGHVKRAPPRPRQYADMPESLEALVLSCLEKSPDQRPQSVRQVLRELERIKTEMAHDMNRVLDWRGVSDMTPSMNGSTADAGLPDSTLTPRSITHNTMASMSKSRGWKYAAGALGVVLLASGLWAMVGRHPDPPAPAAPTEREVTIDVSTSPQAATVAIDGAPQVLRTPYKYKAKLKDGKTSIALYLEYRGQKLQRIVEFGKDETVQSVSVDFPGSLKLEAPFEVIWTIDDQTIKGASKSYFQPEIKAGSHTVTAKYNNQVLSKTLDVSAGEPTKWDAEFQAAKPTSTPTSKDKVKDKNKDKPRKPRCDPNSIGVECD